MKGRFALCGLVLAVVVCAGLPAEAGTAEMLAVARDAAQQDRNADAARLFGQAVATGAPSPRVLAEYADQLT